MTKKAERCPVCGNLIRRRKIEKGDMFYLMGKNTKVEVIDNCDDEQPYCKIIERSSHSRYRMGQRVAISRRVLYPRKGK